MINNDFSPLWRDLEYTERMGLPADLSSAILSASKCAYKEDEFIFFGDERIGYKGLLTEDGVTKQPISEWSEGAD